MCFVLSCEAEHSRYLFQHEWLDLVALYHYGVQRSAFAVSHCPCVCARLAQATAHSRLCLACVHVLALRAFAASRPYTSLDARLLECCCQVMLTAPIELHHTETCLG